MSGKSSRPVPPDLLFLAAGLWSGAAGVYYQFCLPSALSFEVCTVASVMLLVIGFGGFAVLRYRKRTFSCVLLVVLGLGLGALVGVVAAGSLITQQELALVDHQSEYIFEITEDLREGEFGSSTCARTKLSDGREVVVRLSFSGEESDLAFGDLISAKAFLKSPSGNAQEYYWTKGIAALATVYSYEKLERTDLYGSIVDIRSQGIALFSEAEGEGTALLRALLFGERSGLEANGFYRDIRVVGLAHLVAVSGAHLVIVSASVGMLLRSLRMPRGAVAIIQSILIVAYLVFTGIPVSALRAALMASISLLSFFAKRKNSSLNALSLAVMVMVLGSPASALSVSFLLSVLSTLGIVVFSPLLNEWSGTLSPKIPTFASEGVSLTLAASIPITMIAASLFSQVSVVSPLANLIAAPFFSLVCVLGLISVIITLLFPPLSGIILPCILLLAQAFSEVIRLMSHIPYAALPISVDFAIACVFSLALFIALWSWWPKLTRPKVIGGASAIACSLILTLTLAPIFQQDEIIMLDVGQGDAFVVRSRGSIVLIDTGNRDTDLLRGLGEHGVYALDAIIISHVDDDHCGSLTALQGYVRVDAVCLSQPVFDCGCSSCEELLEDARDLVGEEGVKPLLLGDHLAVGDFKLEVIWPKEFSEEGGNADSLSLLLSTPRSLIRSEDEGGRSKDGSLETWSVLFCGDAEQKELESMIEGGRLGDIDILKVGHHGSKNALNKEALSVLKPELALISVGENNRYGHPAQITLETLSASKIMRTDLEGDVVCRFSPSGIEVRSVG